MSHGQNVIFSLIQVVEDVFYDQAAAVPMPSVTMCFTPSFNLTGGGVDFKEDPVGQYNFTNYCPGLEGEDFVECIEGAM